MKNSFNVKSFVAGLDSRIKYAKKNLDLHSESLSNVTEDDDEEYIEFVRWQNGRAQSILETLQAVKRDVENNMK